MRILLTNNHLMRFGGSETWTLTMAQGLVEMGYDVGVYTHHKGVISDILIEHIDDNPKGYDVALINHNSCAGVDAKKKIYTSHGWADGLETPPEGMDEYVAVSENVAKRHGIKNIIRNPIDTERFKPITPIRENPERILSITSHPIPIDSQFFIDAKPEVTYPSRYTNNMPELMENSDVVVTVGRGVLEAMSSARNVIVYDQRPVLGYLADGYLEDFSHLKGNVGGEYHLESVDIEEELKKYKQEHGKRNREYVVKHHNVKHIINQYMELI